MRAHLRAFFEDAHGDVSAMLGGELFETNGRRQTRRPGADDHHVILH
jgi:hypothetical protein